MLTPGVITARRQLSREGSGGGGPSAAVQLTAQPPRPSCVRRVTTNLKRATCSPGTPAPRPPRSASHAVLSRSGQRLVLSAPDATQRPPKRPQPPYGIGCGLQRVGTRRCGRAARTETAVSEQRILSAGVCRTVCAHGAGRLPPIARGPRLRIGGPDERGALAGADPHQPRRRPQLLPQNTTDLAVQVFPVFDRPFRLHTVTAALS